jgi:hypothetical protein
VEKIPETASDISPYATSALQPTPGKGNTATLGRKETLRLTDYHRQGDTLRIRQQVRPGQLYCRYIFFKDSCFGRKTDKSTVVRQFGISFLGGTQLQFAPFLSKNVKLLAITFKCN